MKYKLCVYGEEAVTIIQASKDKKDSKSDPTEGSEMFQKNDFLNSYNIEQFYNLWTWINHDFYIIPCVKLCSILCPIIIIFVTLKLNWYLFLSR